MFTSREYIELQYNIIFNKIYLNVIILINQQLCIIVGIEILRSS